MSGLGIGKKRLVEKIILDNWNVQKPEEKHFSYNEVLYLIQELMTDEGKKYLEGGREQRVTPFHVFKKFTEYLLFRNLANFDSMVLITSEKGCITGDALLEMPRDLTKYPKGIPLKELEGKGPQWVYSFNRETQKLEVKKCDGVEFVKEDDVYEIELTNGQKLQATGDHPMLLTNGKYKQIKDLFWEDKYPDKAKNSCSRRYRVGTEWFYSDRLCVMFRPDVPSGDNFIKYDYSPINKTSGDTSYKHSIMEHRLIAEAIFGDIRKKIIHHKDGNHYNNTPENIDVLDSQSKHHYEHGMEKYHFKEGNKFCCNTGYSTIKKEKIENGTEKFSKMMSEKRIAYFMNPNNKEKIKKFSNKRRKINPIRSMCQNGGVIKSIRYVGKKKVYDVVNVRDNHNFIVNGFIVSNTGKSSAAIMLARQWCKLLGIRFDPAKHIAYNNADVMAKIDQLPKFNPIVCDEAVRFASSADWAKRENKDLKKKLAQVRTKHMLYILCFPLKIGKLEKNYLESFTNYWIDLFGRGVGACYVKDRNPVHDTWRMKDFQKIGSYTEFTNVSTVEKILKKHPNFWQIVKFPKPPEWLYGKYLEVREKNIYDDANVMANVTKEDIHNALLIMALRDIMMHDTQLTMNRIILHIKNEYDIKISKGMVHNAIEDAKQLVAKVREQAISI